MKARIPVLLVTQNLDLRQQWLQLDPNAWQPSIGVGLDDLGRWRDQGRELVVLDGELPQLPAWEASDWPQTLEGLKVLVLSATPSDDVGRKVLGAGASGYAHAGTSVVALERMLQSLVDGNIWLGRSLLQRLLQGLNQRLPEVEPAWSQGLTQREQEVAYFAATGESNTAIGERLGITERTVRAHLSAVFEKLQVADRLMLALRVHGVKVPPKSSGS